ncbi:MAG: hypothetical protein NT163_05795 [Chlorobiales bacterium]|nr:hypothetical protein [Chlorobiales bacterium]
MMTTLNASCTRSISQGEQKIIDITDCAFIIDEHHKKLHEALKMEESVVFLFYDSWMLLPLQRSWYWGAGCQAIVENGSFDTA